jgi:hypothetical protein
MVALANIATLAVALADITFWSIIRRGKEEPQVHI